MEVTTEYSDVEVSVTEGIRVKEVQVVSWAEW